MSFHALSGPISDNRFLEKEFAPELLKELQDLEKQAVNHANEGRLQDALNVLDQCITREPDYASAYNNR